MLESYHKRELKGFVKRVIAEKEFSSCGMLELWPPGLPIYL